MHHQGVLLEFDWGIHGGWNGQARILAEFGQLGRLGRFGTADIHEDLRGIKESSQNADNFMN